MVPDRQHLSGNVPFNLMKSEKLVWVMDDVDYIETVVRRGRRGSSHGLSIRIARGVYYRPSAFRSRAIEWEETVHQDTGLLGFTTKHIYFSGPKKKFRVRYQRPRKKTYFLLHHPDPRSKTVEAQPAERSQALFKTQ